MSNLPSPAPGSPLTPPGAPYVVRRPTGHQRPSPDTEWVLALGNGGFAMGTASLVNRRKYHALFIASANPPVERVSCLSGLDEVVTVVSGGKAVDVALATHRHVGGSLEPRGVDHLDRFEKTPTTCLWVYAFHGVEVVKELRLAWRRNACAIRYIVRDSADSRVARIVLRPRVTLRDFHGTLAAATPARWDASVDADAFAITAEGHTLHLRCPGSRATLEPSVLGPLHLDMESERAQEDVDHVFSPGEFWLTRPAGHGPWEFRVAASMDAEPADVAVFDDDARDRHLAQVREAFAQGDPRRAALFPLVDAADDFLVPRTVDGVPLMTVLAGFPWFADWGRDTMISLAGLMLTTRRFEDARGCLETFARYVSKGMIPNLFDDYGGPPQYNTVDASLWFLHAAASYLHASGDRDTFKDDLLPACLEIIEHYQSGTRFGIRMDPADGLIEAGDATTQLTWMDAKREGVVFTPRHGKAVEINALWHHGLRSIAGAIRDHDPVGAAGLDALAGRVALSFRASFWFEREQRLHDCLQKDAAGAWMPVREDRPNQIFAASLEHSPLLDAQKAAVVEHVRRRFVTPVGLRTLAASDPGYRPRFEGDMMARDGAYHNGTVWPWLIGAYCEAALRAADFSDAAKAHVREVLSPLLASMTACCQGQIAEVFDAEEPRRAQGCVAQAWSVGEPLRAAVLSL